MNLWRAFHDLLPDSPRLLGDVETIHGGGTVTVLLLGGGSLRVQTGGVDVTVGARVFVRGGAVEGTAPVLAAEQIEI
ncbi:MAG: hypothetical protein LBE75_03150 [Burkholderiales bacterium]|jgi:hypothetical protein|nr:hypothetical protein [Burkholderiales bacterium]